MLTLDKMQSTSPLMCTKFEILRQSILKVIQVFHTGHIVLYIGCSGPVVKGLNKSNMYKVDEPITGPEHRICRTTRDVFYVRREVDVMKTAKANAYIIHIFGKIELLSIHAT